MALDPSTGVIPVTSMILIWDCSFYITAIIWCVMLPRGQVRSVSAGADGVADWLLCLAAVSSCWASSPLCCGLSLKPFSEVTFGRLCPVV